MRNYNDAFADGTVVLALDIDTAVLYSAFVAGAFVDVVTYIADGVGADTDFGT